MGVDNKMVRILFLLVFITLGSGNESEPNNGLKLKQVLILSRHNLRAPLTRNLQSYSRKIWPNFNVSRADLTQKGALLESYMAEYITEWLESKEFINGCPKPEDILIYSNTLRRTRDTAKSFAKSVFRSCNIAFTHNKDVNNFDPLFLPIVHNNSEYFKQKVIEQMKTKLQEIDLRQAYLELNRILDINNSDVCKNESLCDLSELKDEIFYEEGKEPDVIGALTIGMNIVDTFLMSFYEGFPLEEVAWGEIATDQKWELLCKIIKQSQNVRFTLPLASKDIAGPLLRYMFSIFRNETPKFTVLVGHDSNLNSVINALGFKEFTLRNQYEPFPIGGKLVFQKWSNAENSYLKVEYMYQTFSDLRSTVKLSMAHPPQKVMLELKDCKIDNDGFCPWNEFIKFDF